jgi:hypothetical protein
MLSRHVKINHLYIFINPVFGLGEIGEREIGEREFEEKGPISLVWFEER